MKNDNNRQLNSLLEKRFSILLFHEKDKDKDLYLQTTNLIVNAILGSHRGIGKGVLVSKQGVLVPLRTPAIVFSNRPHRSQSQRTRQSFTTESLAFHVLA